MKSVGVVRCGAFALGLFCTLSALADSTMLTAGDTSATVTGSSAESMDFAITRSGDLSYDAYLAYQTADDTAVAGSDYTASSGTVLIPAGASSATVSVPVLGSSTPKTDRAFKLDVLGAFGVGPAPSFGDPTKISAGYRPRQAVIADFNGDGKLDLAVANGQSTISILFNNTAPGALSPSFALVASPAAGDSATSVAVGDFNGDGRPDLVVASINSNTVSILFNNTAPGATTASFTLAASVAVGNSPSSVAVGDFNGDSRVDVAVANAGGNSVSILLNGTAPGAPSVASFTLAATLSVGASPSAVAVGDFNGDGKLDLAVANAYDRTVSILFNGTAPGASSSASFALAASLAVGSNPTSLAVGDFNGDGKSDLAVANQASSTVSILFNTTVPGASSSASFTLAASAAASNPYYVTAGDLNGDGKPDLATVNTRGDLSILLNGTAPGATDSASFTLAASPDPIGNSVTVAIGDLNGDGLPDLAMANPTVGGGSAPGFVSVLLNTAPASVAVEGFGTPLVLPSADYNQVTATAADFNGDGLPDLLLGSVYCCGVPISVLLNARSPGDPTPHFLTPQNVATTAGAEQVAVADLNFDGRPDFIMASAVMINATATGAAAVSFAASSVPGLNEDVVAVADFDNDGKPDLVSSNGSLPLAVARNLTAAGSPSVSFSQWQGIATTLSAQAMAAADFNGDGKPDIATVTGTSAGNLAVFMNTSVAGSGSLSFGQENLLCTEQYLCGGQYIRAADINGDGRPDLVIVEPNRGMATVFINNTAPGAASPSFVRSAAFAVGSDEGYRFSLTIADMDRDGRPDLLIADTFNRIFGVFLNRTAPGSTVPVFAERLSLSNNDESAAAAADFDGDGLFDLAVPGSGSVSVWVNQKFHAGIVNSSAAGTIHYAVAIVSLSPASLDFGSQRVASSSAAKTVQLSNSGDAPFALDTIAASGDFSQSNDCPASLAPGAQCSISVVFRPTATGARSGTLTVATNAAGSPATVGLSGTGIEPVAEFSAASLSFGEQPVGTTSTAQTLTLNNSGSATLDIASVMASGDFAQHNDCGVMLLPGNSCSISVTFTPAVSGARSGTITVLSDAASSPSIINLSGTGTAPIVHLSASALSFGSIYIGSSSAAQSVTLSNTGNGVLQIASLTISGDFSKTSDCGTTLAPGAACTINVSFTPQAAGARSGALTLSSNVATSPDTVSLSGNGLKHDTQLMVNPALGTLIPPQLYLGASATLEQTTPTVAPLAGKTVSFSTSNGRFICSGVTDANGDASCRGTLTVLGILLGGGYHGSFAGDAQYNASEGDGRAL
ncbi:FG-GAP-like repeat-containing protein [Hydrocarboniphaga sp.]|uniref:FG-GAP-like repeat-containing protein n=1 Tax=Hydrocarboniphaga sp. TaxID=2033016 RepID=UPI00262A6744|nr:FG-GAP-like repeat-containing protein [Hydrocarboniphaga sp.]